MTNPYPPTVYIKWIESTKNPEDDFLLASEHPSEEAKRYDLHNEEFITACWKALNGLSVLRTLIALNIKSVSAIEAEEIAKAIEARDRLVKLLTPNLQKEKDANS